MFIKTTYTLPCYEKVRKEVTESHESRYVVIEKQNETGSRSRGFIRFLMTRW